MNRTLLIASLLGILLVNTPALRCEETVRASLVSAQDGLAPGTTATLALKLEIAEHWHTYWINPGETGFPTTVTWHLPEGFTAGPLLFPVPTSFTTAGIPGFGYEGTVYHLAKIQVPASARSGSSVTLRATAQWLACDPQRCIPGDASLEITLPIKAAEEITATGDGPAITATMIPVALPGKVLAVTEAGADLTITVPMALETEELVVFAETPDVVDLTKEPEITVAGSSTTLSLAKQRASDPAPQELTLVLAAADTPAIRIGTTEIAIASSLSETGTPETGSSPADTVSPAPETRRVDLAEQSAAIREIHSWGIEGNEKQHSLAGIIALALLGGMILNLMPCVFPVLGIKIMGFVQQAGEDRATIRNHGLVFGAGVLISLWTLAGVILAIRFGGDQVGWGFQLQNPIFVLVMVVVMFIFGLNLAGLFELGTSLIGAGQELQHKQGYAGSFFSGVLAVAIATPCTGPFMAGALTYALSSPVSSSLLVFTALGIGLALPYVLLSFFPALIEKLPRPGPWMETFKQLMAFPMLAAAVWLLGVLARSLGTAGLQPILYGLVVLAFGLWIYGRYDVPARPQRTRFVARATTLLLGGCFVLMAGKGLDTSKANTTPETTSGIEKFGLRWQAIDPVAVVQHRKKGRTVFIDFTADW